MGNRYVQSDEKKQVFFVDARKLYGWAMSEYLPCVEIKFDRNVGLEKFLNTPNDNDIGYFFEVDLKYPYIYGKKTKNSPFHPENKKN